MESRLPPPPTPSIPIFSAFFHFSLAAAPPPSSVPHSILSLSTHTPLFPSPIVGSGAKIRRLCDLGQVSSSLRASISSPVKWKEHCLSHRVLQTLNNPSVIHTSLVVHRIFVSGLCYFLNTYIFILIYIRKNITKISSL